MDAQETEMLLDDVASVVKLAIERSVEPLLARLAALEKQVAAIPAPKEVDAEAIVTLAVKAIAPEIAGMRADIEAVSEKAESIASLNVPEIIAETVKAVPVPEVKGVSIEEARQIAINEMAGMKALVEQLQPAPLLPDIGKMVDDAVAARIPEDMDERIEIAARKVFDEMEMPDDGVGLSGALIDKAGHLVLTLSSGEVKDVGPVCGTNGQSIDPAAVQKQIADMFEAIPKPKNGESVTLEQVMPAIEQSIAEKLKALPEPKAGASVTVEDVRPMIEAEVAKRFSELPEPEPGRPGESVDPAVVQKMVDDAVALIPKAKDGDDVDMVVVEAKLAEAVQQAQARVSEAIASIPVVKDGVGIADAKINDEHYLIITLSTGEIVNAGVTCWEGADVDMKAVMARVNEALDEAIGNCQQKYEQQIAAIPIPENGKSVTVDEVRPLIVQEVRSAVDALPKPQPGKDGADVIECLIDKDGHLVVTLSDGRLKNVGKVVGRNGDDVDMNAVRDGIQKLFDATPRPKDGNDGLGFEDMTEELEDDGRTIVRRFRRGDIVKEFRHKVKAMVYRGVYREGQQYVPGDVVTYASSSWHCDVETTEKPDALSDEKCWTLMVKRGRDGKDATQKPGPVKL